MAILHRTTLVPSKLELVAAWAPKQAWFEGEKDAALTLVASFRLDDPAGEVGIETLLLKAGDGPVFQVPLTYRGAPLEGGEDSLIGTMEHGVLGTRWVYDGPGDPIYVATTTTAILEAEHEVEMWIELEGVMTKRESTATVAGTGGTRGGALEVVRRPRTAPDTELALVGQWAEQPTPVVLAVLSAI